MIAVNARRNAALNPKAVYRDPMTLDDYFASRMISTPFRLFDCDAPVDGSTAVVVSAAEHAARRRPPGRAGRGDGHGAARPPVVGPVRRPHDDGGARRRRAPLDPHRPHAGRRRRGRAVRRVQLPDHGLAGGAGVLRQGASPGPFVEGGARIALDGELPAQHPRRPALGGAPPRLRVPPRGASCSCAARRATGRWPTSGWRWRRWPTAAAPSREPCSSPGTAERSSERLVAHHGHPLHHPLGGQEVVRHDVLGGPVVPEGDRPRPPPEAALDVDDRRLPVEPSQQRPCSRRRPSRRSDRVKLDVHVERLAARSRDGCGRWGARRSGAARASAPAPRAAGRARRPRRSRGWPLARRSAPWSRRRAGRRPCPCRPRACRRRAAGARRHGGSSPATARAAT